MPAFRMEKKVKSCHLTKEIISQLETYILNQIPELTGSSRVKIRNRFSLSIVDKMGSEEVSSISEFRLSYFPDTTKLIIISLMIHDLPDNKSIWIEINFDKDSSFAKLRINFTGDNPKETVIGMYNSIKEIIELKKNMNKIFHLGTVIDGLLLPFAIFLIFTAITAFQKSKYEGGLLFTFVALFFISYYIGKLLKPYITFESNRYYSVKKWSDKLFWGLISFIIFGLFLSTIWLLIRKKILGF